MINQLNNTCPKHDENVYEDEKIEKNITDYDKENLATQPVRKVRRCNLNYKASGALSSLNNIMNQHDPRNGDITNFKFKKLVKDENMTHNDSKIKIEGDDNKRTFVAGKMKKKLIDKRREEEEKKNRKRHHYKRPILNEEEQKQYHNIDTSLKSAAVIKSEAPYSNSKVSLDVLPRVSHRRRKQKYSEKVQNHEIDSYSSDSSVVSLNSQEFAKTLIDRKKSKKVKKKFAQKIDPNYDYTDNSYINPAVSQSQAQTSPNDQPQSNDNLAETDIAINKHYMREIMKEVFGLSYFT